MIPDLDLDKLAADEQAASEELQRLCNGKKFTMCIPAREDDSDLVIARALGGTRYLIERVRELETALAATGAALDNVWRGTGSMKSKELADFAKATLGKERVP